MEEYDLNIKQLKKYILIILMIMTGIIALIGGIFIDILQRDELECYMNNKEMIHQLSKEIFKQIEEGNIQCNEVLSIEYTPERVEELGLSKQLRQLSRKNGIETIRILDNNLIWLVDYGGSFSISGIAITRDGIPSNREDDYYQFDEGTLRYRKIDDNTYFFSAGI